MRVEVFCLTAAHFVEMQMIMSAFRERRGALIAATRRTNPSHSVK